MIISHLDVDLLNKIKKEIDKRLPYLFSVEEKNRFQYIIEAVEEKAREDTKLFEF